MTVHRSRPARQGLRASRPAPSLSDRHGPFGAQERPGIAWPRCWAGSEQSRELGSSACEFPASAPSFAIGPTGYS
jgi:hypothetical protein